MFSEKQERRCDLQRSWWRLLGGGGSRATLKDISPAPRCSSCSSLSGSRPRSSPSDLCSLLEALYRQQCLCSKRECWSCTMSGRKPSDQARRDQRTLTFDEVSDLGLYWSFLQVPHHQVGNSGQVTHVASPGAPLSPDINRQSQFSFQLKRTSNIQQEHSWSHANVMRFLLYLIILLPGVKDLLYQFTLLEELRVQHKHKMKRSVETDGKVFRASCY